MTHKELQTAAERYAAAEQDKRFSDEVRVLLKKQDWDELQDRFYTDLEFGTGGMRGVIGGGFNRINPYVVSRASTGLAEYTVEAGGTAAVIAHDSRRYSREFALSAALVFAAHGLKTYVFSDLRPHARIIVCSAYAQGICRRGSNSKP